MQYIFIKYLECYFTKGKLNATTAKPKESGYANCVSCIAVTCSKDEDNYESRMTALHRQHARHARLGIQSTKGENKLVKRDFSKHTNLLVLMNFLLCR